MRWVTAFLLSLIVLVWYLSGALQPPRQSTEPVTGTLPRVASLKPSSKADPVPESAQPQCVRMGWIDTQQKAEALIAAVPLLRHWEPVVSEVVRELPPLHWVIIPPQPREIALRQFRDIQRRGIDSYLVTEGEYRNAISLGLFESLASARTVLEEKKRQNLNAVLANYDRNQISYALDFEADPDLVEETVQAVSSESGRDFDFVEIHPCEGVATPEKNP